MENKYLFGTVALAMVLVLGVGVVSAFPFGKGLFSQDLSEDEQAELEAFREEVITAVENQDFETWKSLMESQLTEENFENIVERQDQMLEIKELQEELRQAREDGDEETIEEIEIQLQELMPEQKTFAHQNRKGSGPEFGFKNCPEM